MRTITLILLLALPVGQALAQGSISGTIVDETAQYSLLGANVRVFDAISGEIVYQTKATDKYGSFTAGPLPAGTYKIRVDHIVMSGLECRTAFKEFLGNEIPGGGILHADVFDTGRTFVVDGSTTQVSGIVGPARCPLPSECVPTESSLDGILIEKDTGALINGVLVRAKDPVNAMPAVPELTSGQTEDGVFSWRFRGCPSGDAKIRFYDPMGRYSSEYFRDKDDNFSLGDIVSLDNGEGRIGKVFLSRVSPPQQIANLADQVANLPVTDQAKNSLVHSLGQAKAILEDANPNNDKAACGLLKAFINRLDGFVASGQVTPAERDTLVSSAEGIQQQLSCKN
jgi:hypothetical protein